MQVYLVVGYFACFGDDCPWNVALFTSRASAERWCTQAKEFAQRLQVLCEENADAYQHATSLPQEFGDAYHAMDLGALEAESTEDAKALQVEWSRLQELFSANLNPYDTDSAMQWIRERCPIEYRVCELTLDPPSPEDLHQSITAETTPLLARQVSEFDYKKLQELWDLSPQQRFATYDPSKDPDDS